MKVQLELQPCMWMRSGVATYTYEIVRHLKNTDAFEFYGNIFNFLGKIDKNQALSGISIPICENRLMPYGIYRRTWQLLPVYYENLFRKDAEISVFFNFVVPPKIRGKVVTVVHDLSFQRYPETVSSKTMSFLQAGLERSVKRSDRIIAVSRFTKQELMELMGVPEEKIGIVYNAASFSEETIPLEILRDRFGIHGPYLLFVSTIEPRKNLVRLIRAFKNLKENKKIPHQLVLAGGPGWRNEEIYGEAGPLKAKGELIFTGFVSEKEKTTLYQHADALVYPSLYEGFGIPPLEAMHWGCPVVAANTASIPEVVGDAAFLVDPLDEDSIVEGIRKVLTDKELSESLRKKGFEREKLFSWDRSAEDFTKILKEL